MNQIRISNHGFCVVVDYLGVVFLPSSSQALLHSRLHSLLLYSVQKMILQEK